MDKGLLGILLISISAFLYASKYITAALYSISSGPRASEWGPDVFQRWLHYVGPGLSNWALLSFIAGIICIIFAEVKRKK